MLRADRCSYFLRFVRSRRLGRIANAQARARAHSLPILSNNNDQDDDSCNRNSSSGRETDEARFDNYFLIMQCNNKSASESGGNEEIALILLFKFNSHIY